MYRRCGKALYRPAATYYGQNVVVRLSSKYSPSDIGLDDITETNAYCILENIVQHRQSGRRLTLDEDVAFYKAFLQFKKGENLDELDESIYRLFQILKTSTDESKVIKLVALLEKRKWYSLACRVQKVIIAQQHGMAAVKSLRRLAALAVERQDFEQAKSALERAQSVITAALLEKAAKEADFDKAVELYIEAANTAGQMDLVEVLVLHANLLMQSKDHEQEAMGKLQEARTTIRTLSKDILSRNGVVPSHYSEKAAALPTWRIEVEQKIEQLETKQCD